MKKRGTPVNEGKDGDDKIYKRVETQRFDILPQHLLQQFINFNKNTI